MSTITSRSGAMAAIQPDVSPIVHGAYDAFNRRDFGALPALYSAQAELVNMASGETLHGVSGAEQFMRGWIDAFPDAQAEIVSLHQVGDMSFCEFRGKGTHSGTFRTPMGDIPATGRSVDVAFCDVITLDGDRIASIRTYFDAGTFAKQLGL
jgi:ketosteroid isomerase-like protein